IVDMFRTQILPAALDYQRIMATSFLQIKEVLAPHQFHSTKQALYLKRYNEAIEECMRAVEELEKERQHARELDIEAQAVAFSEKVRDQMKKARAAIDHLETLVDDA